MHISGEQNMAQSSWNWLTDGQTLGQFWLCGNLNLSHARLLAAFLLFLVSFGATGEGRPRLLGHLQQCHSHATKLGLFRFLSSVAAHLGSTPSNHTKHTRSKQKLKQKNKTGWQWHGRWQSLDNRLLNPPPSPSFHHTLRGEGQGGTFKQKQRLIKIDSVRRMISDFWFFLLLSIDFDFDFYWNVFVVLGYCCGCCRTAYIDIFMGRLPYGSAYHSHPEKIAFECIA